MVDQRKKWASVDSTCGKCFRLTKCRPRWRYPLSEQMYVRPVHINRATDERCDASGEFIEKPKEVSA